MRWSSPRLFAGTRVSSPVRAPIYWLPSNVLAMRHQCCIVRNMPAPGTEAAKAYEERMRRKGKWKEPEKPTPATTTEPRTGQRQQPKRKSRQQRGGTIPGPKGTAPNKPSDGDGGGKSGGSNPGRKIPGPKGAPKKPGDNK